MQRDPVVILTRESMDNRRVLERLQEIRIPVMEYPCIQTRLSPYRYPDPIDGYDLSDFSTVVFTSRRGVAGMAAVHDVLSSSGQRIAVVGDATARAVRDSMGVEPHLVADPATSVNLAGQLIPLLESGDRVLHVRGNKNVRALIDKQGGRKDGVKGEAQGSAFAAILASHGFDVSELVVYFNTLPELEPLDMPEQSIVLLASPSAAKGFFYYNPEPAGEVVYLAIGPTTAGYLRQLECSTVIEAGTPDIDGIIVEIRDIVKGGFSDE